MLILKSIHLKDFLSHKDTVINFKDNQKLLLSGVSGSGKSSIVESLVFALYNKCRSDSRFLVRHGAKKSEVTVLLYDEDKKLTYKVKRSISSANKHSLDVLESTNNKTFKPVKATGLKNLQEFIEKDLLKASYLLFVNSIVCLQDNDETFVAQTPAKKKDLLLEIISSDNYDDYLKKCKELYRDKNLEIGIDVSKKEEKESQIVIDKEKADKINIIREDRKIINDKIIKAEKKNKELITAQQELTKKIAFISGKETTLNDIVSKINNNDTKINTINNTLKEMEIIDTEKLTADVEELNKSKNELLIEDKKREEMFAWKEKQQEAEKLKPMENNYGEEIKIMNEKIITIMTKEKIPVCKKCGTKYPEHEADQQKRIKELEERLSIVTANKIDYVGKMKLYEDELSTLGTQPVYDISNRNILLSKITTLEISEKKLLSSTNNSIRIEELNKDIEIIGKEQIDLKNQEQLIKNEILSKEQLNTALNQINSDIEYCELKIKALEENRTENNNLLLFAEGAIKNIATNKKDIKELDKEITETKKDIESLSAIKEAFGVNGIKATVVDYMLPELEDRINKILSKLSDFTITLSTQKKGAGKDTILEGLFVNVIDGMGKEMDFDLYSGGEKMKLNFAINEALASLSVCNFRFMDETFSALDDDSLNSFVEIVELLQVKVNNVICISHIQQIKDLFNNKIEIIKRNGVSKIID